MRGRPPPGDDYQDLTYAPDATIEDGDVFEVPGATPAGAAHARDTRRTTSASCSSRKGWLFTGDHLMNGSTVVILPPDGSMRLYLESLRRLRTLPLTALVPGHGAVMPDALDEIERVIAHRLKREAKVIDALQRLAGRATLEALVAGVYDDTPVYLHGLARHSLLAHLQKLDEEGRIGRDGERWAWLGP